MNYTYTIHYEICDNVLNNIQQGDDMHEVNIEPFLAEDRRVKLAIVRKLDKDGYIHRVNPQNEPFKISITVEGRQFWVDGGYKENFEELREKLQLEKELLKANIDTNAFIKKNNKIQIGISVIVGLFVIISALIQWATYKFESSKELFQQKEKQQTELSLKAISDRVKILELQNSQTKDSLNPAKKSK